MYEQEKIKPYGKKGDKTRLVEAMFNNIAPTYDTLNHRLSWNIDKSWRKRAIKKLIPYEPQKILDVATGTGDFALLAAKELQVKRNICSSITGIDISDEMLCIADKKNRARDYGIDFHKDDCMNLSFADGTFDAVIAAFGIRNFSDLERGLSEMCRVLKKGGHLCILELTRPVSFPMKQLFSVYSHTFLPVYGKLVSKDRSAYEYLTATIEAFPQGEQMVGILRKAGFSSAGFKRLTFGICTMYFAEK